MRVVAAICVLLICCEVHADPVAPTNLHMRTASHVVTAGGSSLDLPPGYFLDEPSHDKLDTEVKRLQDAETSLTAQNNSLRASMSGWQPGFYTLALAFVSGVALGVYVVHKL